MSKFKVNDKVITRHGSGIIVYIDSVNDSYPYLVKVPGFDGHNGLSEYQKSAANDCAKDKIWCSEDELALVMCNDNLVDEKPKYNYNGEQVTLHGIFQVAHILDPSVLTGGHGGGSIAYPVAVIEFENGEFMNVQPYTLTKRSDDE